MWASPSACSTGGMVTMQEVMAETIALLSPISCPGCGEEDESLCRDCRGLFDSGWHPAELSIRRELFRVPVWACAEYSGAARSVILGFKDHGHTRLAPFLAGALVTILDALIERDPDAIVVAVPSSWRGKLRRGVEPTQLLTKAISVLRPTWRIEKVLRRSRELPALLAPVSKGLSRAERLSREAPFVVTHELEGERVILLDDVITTGSTIESCARKLRQAGAQVVAAVALGARIARDPPVCAQSGNQR